MDPVQFLKCISFFSLDRIIIYWNKLYDLRSLVRCLFRFVGPAVIEFVDPVSVNVHVRDKRKQKQRSFVASATS